MGLAAGRGGLGGGILSDGIETCSATILCGLVGNVGGISPVRSGVICPRTGLFTSGSRSRLLPAFDREFGDGSAPIWRVLAFAIGSFGRRGLLGSDGGDSSSTLAEPLLGGLLKGDTFSAMFVFASNDPSTTHDFLDLVSGFSERCIGGGVSGSRWRRSSADRRGGGGEGGLKTATFGELRGSRAGGRGALVLMSCLPGTAGEGAGLTASSECKKRGWSFAAMLRYLPFGGEFGGSIVKAGVGTGRGASGGAERTLRAGECDNPFSFTEWGARPGLFLGIGGGSLGIALGSRGLSGFGADETVRPVG